MEVCQQEFFSFCLKTVYVLFVKQKRKKGEKTVKEEKRDIYTLTMIIIMNKGFTRFGLQQ